MAKSLHNLLTYRFHDVPLEEAASRYVRGRLIDIGCGSKPYARMMQPFATDHIGVDHEGSLHGKDNVDLSGTAYDIPVPDASFDSAICTSVLEHLEEPELALRECFRVLRKGGCAIYTVPFIWPLHEEPRDFYRFSKYGIEHLFKKAGFEVIEIRALCGFWGTFGQQMVYYLYRFNRGPLRWFKVIDGVGLVIQGVAYVLDRLDKARAWASLYMVIARKP